MRCISKASLCATTKRPGCRKTLEACNGGHGKWDNKLKTGFMLSSCEIHNLKTNS